MISADNVTLRFGHRLLFEDVSIKFSPGNCYGLIGANGSGKSTFLKILAGEIETSSGTVSVTPGARIAMLNQDHFAFDDVPVLQAVIMGHRHLWAVTQERDALYAKPDFSDADGLKASTLEAEFAHMNGWEAESEAAKLLKDLDIQEGQHVRLMRELSGGEKVRVLLAQALFGNPDILLMDEPTNNLDVETIVWLENFLYEFQNIVIVVSHDRHFLDKVCTHIADIDYSHIQLYTGNFSFWREASNLALSQKKDHNKKMEAKMDELKSFIARFSANASKARQATSRKIMLDKITLEDIKPSTRRYPSIMFKPAREAGNDLLTVSGLAMDADDGPLFENLSFTIRRGEKVVFIGRDRRAVSALFQILMGEVKPRAGEIEWGVTTARSYFPKDNTGYFDDDINLVDWLRQYSKEKDETFIRGFLGRMLFSGEETQKTARVLSGGEKVRCMLARMMLSGANVLVLDEPTNHLDLESITALNDGLAAFHGTALFTSHDHQFIQTIANRIIEVAPHDFIDQPMTYDEFLESPQVAARRKALHAATAVR